MEPLSAPNNDHGEEHGRVSEPMAADAIRNLEAAIETLSDRVDSGERQLKSLEKDVCSLAELVSRTGGRHGPSSQEGVDATSVQPLELSGFVGQLARLDAQLDIGERRLSNQEQAVRTVATVIERMAQSVDMVSEAPLASPVGPVIRPNYSDQASSGLDLWSSATFGAAADNARQVLLQNSVSRVSGGKKDGLSDFGTSATSSALLDGMAAASAWPIGALDINDWRSSRMHQGGGPSASATPMPLALSSFQRPLPAGLFQPEQHHGFGASSVEMASAVGRVSLPDPSQDDSKEEFPSLQRDGERHSVGSAAHPDHCRPCSFYCFSKRGCKKESSCEFCHMLHISRSTRSTKIPGAKKGRPVQR